MRLYFHDAEIDLGSSGVEPFSLAEVCELTGLDLESLAPMRLEDGLTLGGGELRHAIADRLATKSTEVMVTHGSSEAIALAFHAVLKPGDEVITIDPVYQQLRSTAEAIGCRVRPWTLRRERRFEPDLDGLSALLSESTRMVVVNFPHNPTGATLSPEQQLDLVQRVARSGAYLLWDGACEDLAEKADRLPCPNSLYDRSISLGTLSKSFGAPGLRVGWLAASDGILRRCVQLRDYLTLHLSPLIERIALSVLRRPEALLELRWRQVTKNLQVLAQWVEEHQPGVEWVKPKGGVCSFPRLPVSDVEAFCHRLARQQGVLLVPGTVFGCPRAVRLGFGTSTHELKIGLAKLSEALSAQQRGAVS